MRASIRYSQNFLRPTPFLERLIAGTSLNTQDTVLDIGAGKGTLTRLLAKQCRHVIAIEADPRLAADLRKTLADVSNIEVYEGDFLTMPLPDKPYKVLANIPFNRTSDIVRKLLDTGNPPADCYLIMQREAAEKFTGAPGHHSLFSIIHAPRFATSITHQFRASDFTPEPNVSIVMLHCQPRAQAVIGSEDHTRYEDFVSYIFNHSNPTVLPSLQKLFPPKAFTNLTEAIGSQAIAKPSNLPPAAWLTLFQAFLQSATPKQLQLIAGSADKLRQEAGTIEKHHRTRQSKNWRDAG